MNKIDLTKPVRTRNGKAARIICTDRAGVPGTANEHMPIVALVDTNGAETPFLYDLEGRFSPSMPMESPYDLVNIPETVERFINIYPAVAGKSVTTGGSYISADSANRGAGPRRNGVMKITFEGDVPVKMEYEAV